MNIEKLNDLIAELLKIRDNFGNIPVMQTAYDPDREAMRTEPVPADGRVFWVHEADDSDPVLEVRVTLKGE